MSDWVSPRLEIRFEWTEEGLTLYRPDGSRFQTLQEIKAERDVAQAKADRLAQRLRELGVDPENL
jgi:hypothetical protein